MAARFCDATLVVDSDENRIVGPSGLDAEGYGRCNFRCVCECLKLGILEEEVVEFGDCVLELTGKVSPRVLIGMHFVEIIMVDYWCDLLSNSCKFVDLFSFHRPFIFLIHTKAGIMCR